MDRVVRARTEEVEMILVRMPESEASHQRISEDLVAGDGLKMGKLLDRSKYANG